MEIGTEISKKIRAAIKGKLQELGAYIDEELPDYIMVMVANKKTSQQMADDLSLFLGNNTIKFTAWLNGVLEKLRCVAVEPASHSLEILSDSSSVAGRSRSSLSEDDRTEELKLLAVSSSHPDRTEARVSSSAHESRRGNMERSSSRLTSAVRPLVEQLPSDGVIDIKPEMDYDLIAEDAVEMGTNHSRTRTAGRPTAEIYRPGQSRFTSATSANTYRPTEGSSHSRQQDSRSSRTSRSGSSKQQEELSRKRKAPVASSVVRVNRAADEDSDDLEEEELSYGGRGMSSRVSLPAKPERKPTLPPGKQANRNLILKAISEAQDSITKTTAFPPLPQRQTVPVAPRTRLSSSEEMTAAIQLVQEHIHSLAPRVQTYDSAALPPARAPAQARTVASRLQLDAVESNDAREQRNYAPSQGPEGAAGSESKPFDTRSFIVSRPQLEQTPNRTPQHLLVKDDVRSALPRTVQPSKEKGDSASPKFIVTLDGIPSPLGNFTDCDMELDDVRPPKKVTDVNRGPKVSILHRLQGVVTSSEDDLMEIEMVDADTVPSKKQKVTERCRFWPACKSGDECVYHHPTAQCKTFPNCRFGDKCLFIHPNCKYDARCTKSDCPFTHVSRRGTAAPPPPKPAAQPVQTASVCRFFPECKKMDCPFFHPKPCRFAAKCKRVGCTFYHPTTSVPPRHALKWTKAQSS